MRKYLFGMILALGLAIGGIANAQVQMSVAPYPSTAVPETSSATGIAAAQVVATLAAAAGKTTYISGFCVTTVNPAAVVSGVVTVAGTITGTLNFDLVESATAGGQLCAKFQPPIPASAPNTTIVVTLPAISSGAIGAVEAHGFQL